MGEGQVNNGRTITLERIHSKQTMLDVLTSSGNFLDNMIAQLEEAADYTSLKEVSISYAQSFRDTRKAYPNQVVAVIGVFQHEIGPMVMGILSPNSDVITTRRSDENKWGAGTWAVPMGKIEEQDASSPTDSLGDVIQRTAGRELDEEMIKERTGGFMAITHSFLDEESGKLIHVLVDEIGDNPTRDGQLTVALPDTREHSDIRWTPIKDIPTLSPITPGSKFAFLNAFKFIRQQNATAIASGRYV